MPDEETSTVVQLKAAWAADDRNAVAHFQNLVDRFGVDSLALGWRDLRSQTARFAVLASGGLDPGASLLDISCGQGDLFAWRRDNGHRVDYRGVDLTPEMVAIARVCGAAVGLKAAECFVVVRKVVR